MTLTEATEHESASSGAPLDTLFEFGTLAVTIVRGQRTITARVSGDIDITVTDAWSKVLTHTADLAGDLSDRRDSSAVLDLTSVTFFSVRAMCMLAEAVADMPVPVDIVATDTIARHIGLVLRPGQLHVVTSYDDLHKGRRPNLRLVSTVS